MAIDGLIILDNFNRPIIQTSFQSTSPATPLLHIDAWTTALAKADPSPVDPVLHVDAHSACCHLQSGGITFLAVVSGDVDPLFAFAFLRTFIDILQEYFDAVSPAILRDNFDVVYQLLEETLDSSGHPLTTSPNALRDIVLPPSLLNKLLTGVGAGVAHQTPNPFASPIPWRKSAVRYNSNEIYFDIIEDLRAIVGRNGVPLSINVYGKVDANSRLSGTPDLLLSFTNPQNLVDCSFHPCVRLPRWKKDNSLSFVPPDGKFTLMEYRYAPGSFPLIQDASAGKGAMVTTKGSMTTSMTNKVQVPVGLKSVVEIGENGAILNFTLIAQTRSLEDLTAEFYLGKGAGGMSGVVVSPGGRWEVVNGVSTLKWTMQSVQAQSTHTFRGTFGASTTPRPSRSLHLHFTIPQSTFSSLKVDQLRLAGEGYKPYKGVRGRCVGEVEFRV
ncbi:hypothetical protein JAAARDRAFT_117303 [Jaapia argillacea MUCL 33604]|uniref:MHD domain-containing protein n=1 Tax=Jaapia argillacea MUCL 33604 TaxID=933084 RepID=A0A067QN49_9AGAM|nr:hypothetical protein JAAARDRAFT_117303 [Jaapia argillacea MUCL 33604]